MTLNDFTFLAPVSLFLIINPVSTAPVFLAITPDATREERIKMARTACLISTGILLTFAVVGQHIFSALGITLPAFQIAGGLLLSTIAFDMLRATQDDRRLTPEERKIAAAKEDIVVIPLAVPLLCGPGAISTTVILQAQAQTLSRTLALYVSIPLVYALCFLVLKLAAQSARWLNPIFLRLVRRLMGLLFLAVAVQFVINGISALPIVTSKL